MKKAYAFLISLLFMSIVSSAQPGQAINTTHSNIKHGITATYSTKGGLKLTLKVPGTTTSDKQAIASGKFIVDADITLTDAECKTTGAPKGTKIPKGKYDIVGKKIARKEIVIAH